MAMQKKLPEYQDEVKHRLNDTTGIVIARYSEIMDGSDMLFIDVRGFDDKIYYHTPAANWATLNTEDERYGRE